MVKKLFYAFMALLFICAFTITTTPVYAQEEEEEVVEDVADISLEDLLNVEITTAGKKAQRVADIPASIVLITRADIERYGYQTLDEVLENVPGLFGIDQRSSEGMIFGVRGFWTPFATNVIFLINGVRQERMLSDGAVYCGSYIPVESIDRIEVIRGPMSVIYGPGAFFGVINIFTNDGTNKSQLAFAGGTEKTYRVMARAAYNEKDINIVFNAGYYDTEGPDIPHSKMSTYDLSGITPFTSTEGKLGDGCKFFNLSGSYKGFYANINYDQRDKQFYLVYPPSSSDGTHYTRTYTSLSFGYKADISDQFSLDGKFTYHKGSTYGDFSFFVPEDFNVGGDFNHRQDYEVDVTAIYNPSKKFTLTTGLYYKKLLFEQLESVYPFFGLFYRLGLIDPVVNQAAFIQTDIAPVKTVRFVLGVRFDQTKKYLSSYKDLVTFTKIDTLYDYDKVEVLPRVGVLFYLNDKNIVKLLYGKAISVPTLYQNLSQARALQPSLVPEFISTMEFNYLAALSEKFNLNLSVFYNKFDNLIINQPIFDPVTGTWSALFFSNTGKLETIGGELTILARPVAHFIMELSGTIQKTKDKRELFQDIEVPYSPKALGYIKLAYTSPKFDAAVTGRYVGAMETYTLLNPDGSLGAKIANSTDGYFLVGANLRINDIFGKGFYLAVSGSNLFDTEYWWPSSTLNATWADIGLYGNGRRIMATIGKKFVPMPMP